MLAGGRPTDGGFKLILKIIYLLFIGKQFMLSHFSIIQFSKNNISLKNNWKSNDYFLLIRESKILTSHKYLKNIVRDKKKSNSQRS